MPATRRLDPGVTRSQHIRAALPLGGLVLVVAAVYFVRFGRINHDEGWGLYAAQLVFDGYLPYRDFPFYQAPLLPVLYGLPQWLIGGIAAGRWTSFAASAVMCGLAFRLAYERGGVPAVAFFIVGLAGAPLALWALVTTRTEPLSALFLVAAAFFLLRPRPRRRDGMMATLAGVLAAATRISLVPAAFVIAAWAIRRCANARADAMRMIAPALVVSFAIAFVILSGGVERAWVNLVEIQSQRHEQFDPPIAFDSAAWLASRWDCLVELSSEFGIVSVLACIASLAWMTVWLLRRPSTSAQGSSCAAGPVALLVWVAWLPNLAPRTIYPVYFVPVMPLVLVLGGWGIAALRARWLGTGIHRKWWDGAALLVGFAVVLIQGTTFVGRRDVWTVPPPSDLQLLRAAAREVEARVPAEAKLLTFDTYLAVEAGRRVPSGFEMSVFSWFPKRPAEDGRRLGLLTTRRLLTAFEDPEVGGVALSDQALGILISSSHFGHRPHRILSEGEILRALPVLRRFRLVRTFPRFGIQRSPLYLFVPKGS